MVEWLVDSNLPALAREKLAAPLRDAVNETVTLGSWHVLPVTARIWNTYGQAIIGDVEAWVKLHSAGPRAGSYKAIRDWSMGLLDGRIRLLSKVYALVPFEPFDEAMALELLGTLDWCLFEALDKIEGRSKSTNARHYPPNLAWLSVCDAPYFNLIARFFGVADNATHDEHGEFSPSRILSKYYLKFSDLIDRIIPGLVAVGAPNVGDPLIALTCLGWLLGAEDPVAAYCSMDAFRSGLYRSADTPCRSTVLQYLAANETALRQNRARITKLSFQVCDTDGVEQRNLYLAELYKRLIEGAFRRYGWALHCLNAGGWSEPPTLTPLRDAIVAQGGWLGGLAGQIVIRDLRNGEAHENLYWGWGS